jgi:hypothetical protein
MKLPEGAVFAPGEIERVEGALKHLQEDPHAPRELSVRVIVHVHNEYPKHVVTGTTEEGEPITKVVNSAEEEAALQGAQAPADPGPADPGAPTVN